MKSSYSNYTSSSPSLLNSASSSDSQLPERYRDLLKLFVVTHNNYARVAYENASMDETSNIFLNEIRKLCRDDYEQNMTKIIELMILSSTRSSAPGASSETDRLSIILKMLSEHKSLDKYQLVANDLWENGKINVVMIVLERLWSDNVKKTFSFGASLDYSFTPSRSPGAGNSVSMTIEAINYVHSVSPEFITRVVEKLLTPLIDKLQITTCQIPLEAIFFKKSSKTDAIDLVSDSSRPSSPYDESNPHLLWEKGLNLALMRLEECAHHLLPSVSQIEPQIELLKAIIKKKISIKESLTGYTICLKEFLGKYPNFREQQYSLFCCLSHSAVPSCDIQWSAKLPESVNFDQDILNSPFLKSEIVLRDLLASTPHLSYMNNSRSLLTDFNNTAPLPIVKSEPDWNSRSNSPKLERMDSIKRKRGSSSASSNVCPFLSLLQ